MELEDVVKDLAEKGFVLKFSDGIRPNRRFILSKNDITDEISEKEFNEKDKEEKNVFIKEFINKIEDMISYLNERNNMNMYPLEFDSVVKSNFDNYVHKIIKVENENYYLKCKEQPFKRNELRALNKNKKINCHRCQK